MENDMAEAKKKRSKKVSKKTATKVAAVSKKTKKKVSKKAAAPAVKASKAKIAYPPFADRKNIGNYAKNMILQGIDTAVIVERVQKKFPDSSIKPAAVGYYRMALKKEGFALPG